VLFATDRSAVTWGSIALAVDARGEVVERVHSPVLLVRAGRRASERGRRLAGDETLTELRRATAAIAGQDTRALVLRLIPPAGANRVSPTRTSSSTGWSRGSAGAACGRVARLLGSTSGGIDHGCSQALVGAPGQATVSVEG